jgi:hypothetical protein
MSFSDEALAVLQRKPLARYADFTAGNRVMWRKRGYDNPLIVFFDKEPNLLRPPDILCEWVKIPEHFPRDFFKWGLFDPPHTWFSKNSLHNNPRSYNEEGNYTGMWWGNGICRRKLIRDVINGQKALAEVTPILLFKWNETSIPLHQILTCFTEFREERRIISKSPFKRGRADTWWVKLVRR